MLSCCFAWKFRRCTKSLLSRVYVAAATTVYLLEESYGYMLENYIPIERACIFLLEFHVDTNERTTREVLLLGTHDYYITTVS
jgi:hypothetical protein